jgi:2-polyprenyl-6-methoxyphenol hydroxylase-like FAD-dependent oxidoreductase
MTTSHGSGPSPPSPDGGQEPALVVGAGLAGLTTAIALRQRGIETKVFERRASVDELHTGSGLHLGYNATRALRSLGLLDRLEAVSAPATRLEASTAGGTFLGAFDAPAGERQVGVVRAALHDVLLGALDEGVLELGARFTGFEQGADGVTARFEDGRRVRGGFLVGADGIYSTVRAQLLGEAQPRYAGYTARRGVVASDLARQPRSRMVLGRGRRFVFYPVARGLMYWTAVTNEPEGSWEGSTPAELKRTVLDCFAGWPQPVEQLVRETQESDTFHADIHDRDPVERWGEGRVTLLGDAAHPMTFDMGQGASQSMEGAVVLARHVAAQPDPVAALRAYEAERVPRTGSFVLRSRRVGSVGQWSHPSLCFARDHVLARVVMLAARRGLGAKELQVDF